jgi:hypothetical protein
MLERGSSILSDPHDPAVPAGQECLPRLVFGRVGSLYVAPGHCQGMEPLHLEVGLESAASALAHPVSMKAAPPTGRRWCLGSNHRGRRGHENRTPDGSRCLDVSSVAEVVDESEPRRG